MTEAAPAEAPMVDCHSHIFAAGQPFVASPRHRPDDAYTADRYLETLDAHGARFGGRFEGRPGLHRGRTTRPACPTEFSPGC